MTVSTAAQGRSTAWLAVATVVYLGSVAAMVAADVPVGLKVAAPVVQLAMMGAGAAIAVRSDAPLLGWLLVASGATISYWSAVQTVPATSDVAVLGQSVGPLSALPFLLVIAMFPNPRPVNRLVGWVVRFAVVTATVSVFLMVAVTLDLVGGEWATYRLLFELAIVGTLIGTAVNHIRTYRGRPRIEQLQLKYFVLVLGVGALMLFAGLAGIPGAYVLDPVMPGIISITILLAITRYRLFEIDRIISRTVAYALVVGVLGAFYLGAIAGLTTLLPAQDRLAVALTTVAVLALFQPLLRRVRDVVDRRFDRTRYEARQVVEQFGRSIRGETDVEAVHSRLHDVVGGTIAPATVAVWEPSVRSGGAA